MSMPTDGINALLAYNPLHLWVLNETSGTTFADQVTAAPSSYTGSSPAWASMPLTAAAGCVPAGWVPAGASSSIMTGYRQVGGPQTPCPSFDGSVNAYASATGGAIGQYMKNSTGFSGFSIIAMLNSLEAAPATTSRTIYCEATASSTERLVFNWTSSSNLLKLVYEDDNAVSHTASNTGPGGVFGGEASSQGGGNGAQKGGQLLGVSVTSAGSCQFYRNGMLGPTAASLGATVDPTKWASAASINTYVGQDPANTGNNMGLGTLGWVCVFPFAFTPEQFDSFYLAICPDPPNGGAWRAARSGLVLPNSQLWNQKLSDNAPVDPNSASIVSQWLALGYNNQIQANFSAEIPMFDLDHAGRNTQVGVRGMGINATDEMTVLANAPIPDTFEASSPLPGSPGADAIACMAQPSSGLVADVFKGFSSGPWGSAARHNLFSPYVGAGSGLSATGASGSLTVGQYYYYALSYVAADGTEGPCLFGKTYSPNNQGIQLTPPNTTLSGTQSFPEATVTVASTALLTPGGGTVSIAGVTGNVTYTGIAGNTLTGCTGGTGSNIAGGAAVTLVSGTGSISVPYLADLRGANPPASINVYRRGPYSSASGGSNSGVNVRDFGLLTNIAIAGVSQFPAVNTFVDDGSYGTPNTARMPLQYHDNTSGCTWLVSGTNSAGQTTLTVRLPSPLPATYSGSNPPGPTVPSYGLGAETQLTIGTGGTQEIAYVKSVLNSTQVQLTANLQFSHSDGESIVSKGYAWGSAGQAYDSGLASAGGGGCYDWNANAAFYPNIQPSNWNSNGQSASSRPSHGGTITVEEMLGFATTLTGSPPTLPTGTVNVTSIPANTPTSGRLTIAGVKGQVAYTGISGSSFTGCTGGTGTPAAGAVVRASRGINHPVCVALAVNNQQSTVDGDRWPAKRHDGNNIAHNWPTMEGMRIRLPAGSTYEAGLMLQASTADPVLLGFLYDYTIALRDYGYLDNDSTAGNGVGFIYCEDTLQCGREGLQQALRGLHKGSFGSQSFLDFVHGYTFFATASTSSNVLTAVTMNAPNTTLSGTQSFPEATVTVASTTGYPTAGKLSIAGVSGTVTYTGVTSTTFTGCTGGTGSGIASGAAVSFSSTASTGNLPVGTPVTGTGIPAGTVVNATTGTTVTLSDVNGNAVNPTASGTAVQFQTGSAQFLQVLKAFRPSAKTTSRYQGAALTFTANLTSGQSVLSSVSSFANLLNGMVLTAPGYLPDDTSILPPSPSGSGLNYPAAGQINMNNQALQSGTGVTITASRYTSRTDVGTLNTPGFQQLVPY